MNSIYQNMFNKNNTYNIVKKVLVKKIELEKYGQIIVKKANDNFFPSIFCRSRDGAKICSEQVVS